MEGQIQRVKFCSEMGLAEEREEEIVLIWAYYTVASWAIALPEKQKLGPEGSTTVTTTHHAGP